MKGKDRRFRVMKREDFDAPLHFASSYIMVDKITGVNYIVISGISSNGGASSFAITPLLKADGKPAISDVSKL